MNIATYICSSCAVASIADLGSHKNALDAMTTFCRSQLGVRDGSFIMNYSKVVNTYIFCAGPEEPGHGHSKNWVKYGTEFAEFIRTNDLGSIVTTGAAKNLKHHPDTTCQTWAWSPDQKKLEAWWTAELEKSKPKPAPVPQPAVPVANKFEMYKPRLPKQAQVNLNAYLKADKEMQTIYYNAERYK